jgi:hypothetical protein
METTDTSSNPEERDKRGRFTKGHRKRGGRVLGTPNQSTTVMAILAGFGDRKARVAYFKGIARDDPRLAIKLLTKIARRATASRYRAELRAGLWPDGERRRPNRTYELSGLDPRAVDERD